MYGAAPTAFAQETAGPVADDQESAVIVVTAQRREESIQDVPISITAFDSRLLEETGVRDIKDLTLVAPSLMVTSTSNESVTTARIRGIGTVGDNPGLESAVGINIDGVYRPRNGVGFGDLGEMERIELLRGPQGTLFGKNTSAGVISVLTKEPSFTPGFNAELTAGNFGLFTAAASATGPIIEDQLAYRLFIKRSARDGFLDVARGDNPPSTLDSTDNNSDYISVRGQLLFEPTDTFRMRLIGDLTERDENCCAAVQLFTGPTSFFLDTLAGSSTGVANPVPAAALAQPPTLGVNRLRPGQPFDRLAFSNRPTTSKTRDGGISAELNWDFNDWTLTSISAYRGWSNSSAQDVDFSTADIAYRVAESGLQGNKFNFISQEVRLQGELGRLNWLVGGFYSDERIKRRDAQLYGTDYERYISLLLSNGASTSFVNAITGRAPGAAFPVGAGTRDVYSQESTSWAAFTHNVYDVTDNFSITAGLRFTSEDKSVDASLATNGAACTGVLTQAATPGSAFLTLVPAASRATVIGTVCAPWANPAAGAAPFAQSQTEEEWSGTLRATYNFTDAANVFGGYSRGYKGGGFNLDRSPGGIGVNPAGFVTDTSFPAEFVDTYELGVKTGWFNETLLVNLTGYSSEYENFQLNTFTGISFIVTPVREVTSQGFELDLNWLTPVDGLYLQGGLAYSDTRYGDDIRPTGSAVTDVTLPGSQLSLAPEWYVSGSASYERPIGAGLVLKTNLSGRWVSEYNTGSDLLAPKLQDAFALFNARVGFATEDDRWALEFWGQNITDEEYVQVGFNGPLQGGAGITSVATPYNPLNDTITYNAFLGAPQTYGVTLRFRN
jgi:iron complex outermembrane recepter protein